MPDWLQQLLPPATLIAVGGVLEMLRRHFKDEHAERDENRMAHEKITSQISRVERRNCAHTTLIGSRLQPPLTYDEVIEAEREAGVVEPKGHAK